MTVKPNSVCHDVCPRKNRTFAVHVHGERINNRNNRYYSTTQTITMKMVLVALPLLLAAVSATTDPGGCKYSVESYATTDATIVAQAAFIAEITASGCEYSPSSLYAEVDGKLMTAANVGPDKYQISWFEDFDKVRRGNYLLNLYDEAGNGQLRKLLRDGDSIKSVTPVHSAYVRYPGAYTGPWVSSEVLAFGVCFAVLYVAYTLKSMIVS